MVPALRRLAALAASAALMFVLACSSKDATAPTPIVTEPTALPTRTAALAPNPGPSPEATAIVTTQGLPPIPATAAAVRITGLRVAPNDSIVTVEAASGQPLDRSLDLSGWKFRAGDNTTRVPDGSLIPSGGHLSLHAGTGRSTLTDVYAGLDTAAVAAILKPGVRLLLEDRAGVAISGISVSNP